MSKGCLATRSSLAGCRAMSLTWWAGGPRRPRSLSPSGWSSGRQRPWGLADGVDVRRGQGALPPAWACLREEPPEVEARPEPVETAHTGLSRLWLSGSLEEAPQPHARLPAQAELPPRPPPPPCWGSTAPRGGVAWAGAWAQIPAPTSRPRNRTEPWQGLDCSSTQLASQTAMTLRDLKKFSKFNCDLVSPVKTGRLALG